MLLARFAVTAISVPLPYFFPFFFHPPLCREVLMVSPAMGAGAAMMGTIMYCISYGRTVLNMVEVPVWGFDF